jgi:hypothetical protein
MAKKKNEIQFTIPEATPRTLSMARLAEYLKKLSVIFGHEDHVHFLRMKDGSASAVIETDAETEPLIVERTRQAAVGDGPKEAVYSYESVKEMLEGDNFTAEVTRNGDLITRFVPRVEEGGEAIGPVWQEGTLDGLLVRIEGVDPTIHITLIADRRRYLGETNRDLGMKLGPLFYHTVRIFGKGKWWRTAQGVWELEKFAFQSVEKIDDVTIPDLVAELRAIPQEGLQALKDPLGEMLKIRGSEK